MCVIPIVQTSRSHTKEMAEQASTVRSLRTTSKEPVVAHAHFPPVFFHVYGKYVSQKSSALRIQRGPILTEMLLESQRSKVKMSADVTDLRRHTETDRTGRETVQTEGP